jgi:ABC-type Fe3+/spermidine/putrescine transport system ATPase subunit
MGRTVIIVTHDIAVVERYCDRAMLLRNGKIVKVGKAGEVANRYVFDNMSDEEKRIMREKKQSALAGGGDLNNLKTKEAPTKSKIKKVDILDNRNENKNIFNTGDVIRIKVVLDTLVDGYNIGISVQAEGGAYLFGYNTRMDSYSVDYNKKEIILSLDNPNLLAGLYFVNVSLLNKNGDNAVEFLKSVTNFKIYSFAKESLYKGLINIKHEWLQ